MVTDEERRRHKAVVLGDHIERQFPRQLDDSIDTVEVRFFRIIPSKVFFLDEGHDRHAVGDSTVEDSQDAFAGCHGLGLLFTAS